MMPACFADVAALILKLCVLNRKGSKWSSFKFLSRAALNDARVSDLLLENKKSGPGIPPRIAS